MQVFFSLTSFGGDKISMLRSALHLCDLITVGTYSIVYIAFLAPSCCSRLWGKTSAELRHFFYDKFMTPSIFRFFLISSVSIEKKINHRPQIALYRRYSIFHRFFSGFHVLCRTFWHFFYHRKLARNRGDRMCGFFLSNSIVVVVRCKTEKKRKKIPVAAKIIFSRTLKIVLC